MATIERQEALLEVLDEHLSLQELRRRRAMIEAARTRPVRSDLTGSLLGDPPPGRSALDQKRRVG